MGSLGGNVAGNIGGDSDSGKVRRRISDSHNHQIAVLKAMADACDELEEPKQVQINDIAEVSGLKDEKETQRYLFILEGQKLVTPYPQGDFTSKVWSITKTGFRALKTIEGGSLV